MTQDEQPRAPLHFCPLVATLSVGLAVTLLVSSPARQDAPAFAAPRHVMPLSMWGLILLAVALLLIIPSRLRFHALMAAACWYAFWAASLAYSTRIEANAPLTGQWVYGWICLAHLWLALRLHPPRRGR